MFISALAKHCTVPLDRAVILQNAQSLDVLLEVIVLRTREWSIIGKAIVGRSEMLNKYATYLKGQGRKVATSRAKKMTRCKKNARPTSQMSTGHALLEVY